MAQGQLARSGRIARQSGACNGLAKGRFDEFGRGVARLANTQANGGIGRVGGNTGKQRAQAFKGVSLQLRQMGIHTALLSFTDAVQAGT